MAPLAFAEAVQETLEKVLALPGPYHLTTLPPSFLPYHLPFLPYHLPIFLSSYLTRCSRCPWIAR